MNELDQRWWTKPYFQESQRYVDSGELKPYQKAFLDVLHDDTIRDLKFGGRGMSKTCMMEIALRRRAEELGFTIYDEYHNFPDSDRYLILDEIGISNARITSLFQKETIPIKGDECPPSETKRKKLRAKRKKKGKRHG